MTLCSLSNVDLGEVMKITDMEQTEENWVNSSGLLHVLQIFADVFLERNYKLSSEDNIHSSEARRYYINFLTRSGENILKLILCVEFEFRL